MAFRTFTFSASAANKRVADVALVAPVPQPPTAPRKRSRVGSRGRKATVPAVPVKPENEPWTDADNEALRAAVMEFGERKRDWPKVGRAMAHLGRDKDACHKQWLRLRPPVKGSWTEEEDLLLTTIVLKQGATGWSSIAKHIAGRNAKQCRERWVNHLNPNVNKAAWTTEEDELLMKTHAELGNKWSEIAARLPGRPDNAVKNRYYTLRNRANGGGRKRQRRQRTAPTLASVLAKAANVDMAAVDDETKATLATLAGRFNELAKAQAAVTGEVVTACTKVDATAFATSTARPAQRRRSFHRRSVLKAAAAATAGAGAAVEPSFEADSLDFSCMSMASDALRDVAVNLSVDLDHSVGLESASFASDLLTALGTSLDEVAAAKLGAVATSPASEGRAAATPSPSALVMPAPPSCPRRSPSLRRPARVASPPPAMAVAPLSSVDIDFSLPEGLLEALPLSADEAAPLDELSLNSLSLSLADMSFSTAKVCASDSFGVHPVVAL